MAEKIENNTSLLSSKYLRTILAGTILSSAAAVGGLFPDAPLEETVVPGNTKAQKMDALQAWGQTQGLFTGQVKNHHQTFHIFGSHAKINPRLNIMPAVHTETVMGKINSFFMHPVDSIVQNKKFDYVMTYMHERSHVEYQIGMEKRFEAPGLSVRAQELITKGLASTDAYTGSIRSRAHGAMHERFAEIYGAYALIRLSNPADDAKLKIFFQDRQERREHDATANNAVGEGEFAHDLGKAMALVNDMNFRQVRKMPAGQLKNLALRQASYAYLADATADKKITGWLTGVMTDAPSKKLWDTIGRMGPMEINKMALADMSVSPICEAARELPITTISFGSHVSKCAPSRQL